MVTCTDGSVLRLRQELIILCVYICKNEGSSCCNMIMYSGGVLNADRGAGGFENFSHHASGFRAAGVHRWYQIVATSGIRGG